MIRQWSCRLFLLFFCRMSGIVEKERRERERERKKRKRKKGSTFPHFEDWQKLRKCYPISHVTSILIHTAATRYFTWYSFFLLLLLLLPFRINESSLFYISRQVAFQTGWYQLRLFNAELISNPSEPDWFAGVSESAPGGQERALNASRLSTAAGNRVAQASSSAADY